MPVQTTETAYIQFPDGCKVMVKTTGDYVDLGAIKGTAKAALQWKENQVQTANAGKTALQIKDMVIEGGFTLINLNPVGVSMMSGGIFTSSPTAGDPVATIPNQDIPAAWDDHQKYELIMYTDDDDDTKLKMSTQPVLVSVTLNAGAPEVLVEDTAYIIVEDPESSSGWSIVFLSANMVTETPKTYSITIVYDTNTPVARTNLYAGTSTLVLTAYSIKFEHTDAADKVRGLEIFSANPKSGGFNFDFKGADEDGVEEMPLTFTGVVDVDLTDGQQLMNWYTDTGAA